MGRKVQCSAPGCERKSAHRGLCKAHYGRWQKKRDLQTHKPIRDVWIQHGETCTNDGCNREYYAKGMCKRCYKREWSRQARLRPEHRERHKENLSNYYQQNRERLLEKRRQRYLDDQEYREYMKSRSAEQRIRNKRARFAEIMGK